MSKIPGSDRGFPAEDFFTFHRINDASKKNARVTDSHVLRIHNDGDEPLIITELTTTDTDRFVLSGVTVPANGLTVASRAFIDVTVTFITNSGASKQVLTEKLQISSNAVNQGITATFRGAYMRGQEGGSEINAQQVFESFGFLTEMGRDGFGNLIFRPSSTPPTEQSIINGNEGDMIAPVAMVQADPNKPVQMFQLAAFHSPASTPASLRATQGNAIINNFRYKHNSAYYQTLLPLGANGSTQVAGLFKNAIDQEFQTRIGGFNHLGGGYNNNGDTSILAVRIYKVVDRNGDVVPNEYILLQDYVFDRCGVGSSNCDWNDNVHYIINARPVAEPSAVAIDDVTTQAGKLTPINLANSFDIGYAGNKLTYSASLASGGNIPDWMELDAESGTFEFYAPNEAVGETFRIRVTGTDYNLLTASTEFTVRVTANDGRDCRVNANYGGQPKVIDCVTGDVRLNGLTYTGNYSWSGPGGFSSTERNPLVTLPGTYTLSTRSNNSSVNCSSVSTVQVTEVDDCSNPNQGANFSLEAECAIVGGDWDTQSDRTASGNNYLVWNGDRRLTEPTGEESAIIRFDLSGVSAGNYNIFSRVNAGSRSSDSYWVRINGGAWIPWIEGIQVDGGFAWNQTANAKFYLQEGENTIEFSYRESQVQLDKLFVTKDDFAPDSVGPDATNCSEAGGPEPPTEVDDDPDTEDPDSNSDVNSFVLEAECSVVGSAWDIVEDDQASNDSYVVFDKGSRAVQSAPADAQSHLRFELNAVEAGNYNLQARIHAPDDKSNSFWVRVNGGSWTAWFRDIRVGDAFFWNVFDQNLPLSAGANTIEIAYRETGSRLDKIIVSQNETLPTGAGPAATNCNGALKSTFALEAECATVGASWGFVDASDASNGQYVARLGARQVSAPSPASRDHVRFTVENAEAGSYNLFARILAGSDKNDSYWVRVNEGPWVLWVKGITIGPDFAWNLAPQAPYQLVEGFNTIDFAYRESEVGLDKVVLTMNSSAPNGFGPAAPNCTGEPSAPITDFSLEAECAMVGSNWGIVSDDLSSGGSYVTRLGDRSVQQAPAGPANRVRFTITVAEAGLYNVSARVNAPNNKANSFWVRYNEGPWLLWSDNIVLGDEFTWATIEGAPVQLATGLNTIDFAYRETRTGLDKLYISLDDELPNGFGPEDDTCLPSTLANESWEDVQDHSTTDEEAATSTPNTSLPSSDEVNFRGSRLTQSDKALLYPNPALNQFTFRLDSEYAGRMDVRIVDTYGRGVREMNFTKAAGIFETRIDVSDLPTGTYRLQVLRGTVATTHSFVKL